MPWTLLLSEQLERLTIAFGVSYDDLATILGTDRRTIYRWLANESFPQTASRAALDDLQALAERLDETFDSREGSLIWLGARSGYFGELRPLDALLRGRIDAVNSALDALDAGVFV